MTVDEAEAWIDLARKKGVLELHVGEVRFLLGPLPAESPKPMAKAAEPEFHPADLVANPPDLHVQVEAT